jgi:predicted membrane protein
MSCTIGTNWDRSFKSTLKSIAMLITVLISILYPEHVIIFLLIIALAVLDYLLMKNSKRKKRNF